MAALACFLKNGLTTALRTIATHNKEDIDLAPDQVVDRNTDINRATRSIQYGAALFVDVFDITWSQRNRLGAAPRVESLIAIHEAEYFVNAVAVVQFKNE